MMIVPMRARRCGQITLHALSKLQPSSLLYHDDLEKDLREHGSGI